MSYHVSPQTRSWQVSFILTLLYAFVTRKVWDAATVLVTHKGKTGPANMAECCKAIFEDGKVYTLGEGKKVTTGEIVAKAEAFDAKNAKAKLPVCVEGRHRVVALWLAAEFFGIDIEPEVNEVNDEVAARIGLEANLTNEVYAKLLATEKLGGIVDAVKRNVYKKQTDLPVKRGQQQALWWRSQAVIAQGIALDVASKLSYKEAKDVTEGKLTAEAALSARAGNAAKVMPGEKQRELLTMCKNYDPELKQFAGKFLDALVSNSETTARQLLVEFYKGLSK